MSLSGILCVGRARSRRTAAIIGTARAANGPDRRGPLALDLPRDREGRFEPRLIGKHEHRFTGFDDKIIALYARGLTVGDIQAFLSEMYATDVSADLISTVTEAVTAEVTAWAGAAARADVSGANWKQRQPLEDALRAISTAASADAALPRLRRDVYHRPTHKNPDTPVVE